MALFQRDGAMSGRNAGLSLSIAVLAVFAAAQPTPGQHVLPEIVVTAPSPIVRRAPATEGPAEPAAPVLRGTLPIVTDQFATVTVVPGEELRRNGGSTLGDLLFAKPGITGSSFAPGASSRPIVRGLDNHRVRIQENGIGANGVSDLAEDHGVPIDPLAAERLEVVRGPATLRWGSQAIGGVVNATNNRIPDVFPCPLASAENHAVGIYKAPPAIAPRGSQQLCATFEARGALSSVDRGFEGGLLLDAGFGNFAVHADAFGRRAGDYAIPSYPYLPPADQDLPFSGRQPNSSFHRDGQSFGGTYFSNDGFVGIAISRFSSLYRLPGVESTETNTRIDMHQTKVTSKGEYRPQSRAIEAVRFWLGATDYKHDELANEGGFDGVQQTFTDREQEGRVEVHLTPIDVRFAMLTTALGVQAVNQRLTAPGLEGGLFDPNRTTSLAAFLFSEFKHSDMLRTQVAGRIERNNVTGSVPDLFVDPDVTISRDRVFVPSSGAVGLLKDLPGNLVASITAQYVERAPRAPELFSRGVHEATGTFDIGNPNLNTEVASSVEVGLRRAKGPFRFEATAYYTRFKGFIFRNLTGETCDEDFASCTPGGAGGELSQAVYSQRDAIFRGGEFQSQLDIAPLGSGMFGIENQFDVVRATFTDGTNVPRIPPVRAGGGVFWRNEHWLARINLLHAFPQHKIAGVGETPTGGYNLLRAEVSYRHQFMENGKARELVVGVTGDNLLNEDIRNHVSFKKDEVLMPGRGVRGFARVTF
jgi:iron complex outermembrane receptor protein